MRLNDPAIIAKLKKDPFVRKTDPSLRSDGGRQEEKHQYKLGEVSYYLMKNRYDFSIKIRGNLPFRLLPDYAHSYIDENDRRVCFFKQTPTLPNAEHLLYRNPSVSPTPAGYYRNFNLSDYNDNRKINNITDLPMMKTEETPPLDFARKYDLNIEHFKKIHGDKYLDVLREISKYTIAYPKVFPPGYAKNSEVALSTAQVRLSDRDSISYVLAGADEVTFLGSVKSYVGDMTFLMVGGAKKESTKARFNIYHNIAMEAQVSPQIGKEYSAEIEAANSAKIHELVAHPPKFAFDASGKFYTNDKWTAGIDFSVQQPAAVAKFTKGKLLSTYIDEVNALRRDSRRQQPTNYNFVAAGSPSSWSEYDLLNINPIRANSPWVDNHAISDKIVIINDEISKRNVLGGLNKVYSLATQPSDNKAKHALNMHASASLPNLNYLANSEPTLKYIVRCPLIWLRGDVLNEYPYIPQDRNGIPWSYLYQYGVCIIYREMFFTTLPKWKKGVQVDEDPMKLYAREWAHKKIVDGTYIYDQQFGFNPWLSHPDYGYSNIAQVYDRKLEGYYGHPTVRVVYNDYWIPHYSILVNGKQKAECESIAIDVHCDNTTTKHHIAVTFPPILVPSTIEHGKVDSFSLFKVNGNNNKVHIVLDVPQLIELLNDQSSAIARNPVFFSFISVAGENNIITLEVKDELVINTNIFRRFKLAILSSSHPSNVLIIKTPEGKSVSDSIRCEGSSDHFIDGYVSNCYYRSQNKSIEWMKFPISQ